MAFYKRSVFLIDPPFQIKLSLIICSVIVLSSVVYPIVIYDFFKLAGPSFAAAQQELIIFLTFVQVIITLLSFICLIFITHKIAGPLYKLKNHLSEIREGKEISPLTFRTGDYFPDVAQEVSLFLEAIAEKQKDDFQYIEEVSVYLENLSTVIPDDKKPVLNEIASRLLEIKSRYNKAQ